MILEHGRFDRTGKGRVITLLAEGLQHKEIADRLGCTKGTAKHHVSNIHEKCGNPGNIVSMLRLFYNFVRKPGACP
jgi:FixJ family two-component response regulator